MGWSLGSSVLLRVGAAAKYIDFQFFFIGSVKAAKKGGVTEAELHVVIDALMYKPCNTIELSREEEAAAEGSIKHEAVSLSTCSGLLIILIKGRFHSPTLSARSIAVSWQLRDQENSCFFSRRLQGAIESSMLARSIVR